MVTWNGPVKQAVCRNEMPHLTSHYPCVQDHFETIGQLYPERFEKHFGFWRPYLKEVMIRYLAAVPEPDACPGAIAATQMFKGLQRGPISAQWPEWIDVSLEEYGQDPSGQIRRLYRRYRECAQGTF
jgi:hypothetical protein